MAGKCSWYKKDLYCVCQQLEDRKVYGYRSASTVAEKVSEAARFLWYAEKCSWQQELNGLIKKQPATLEKLEQDCNNVL